MPLAGLIASSHSSMDISSCPAPGEPPFHACTRKTIARASHTICDRLAKHVGISRRSYREEEKTHSQRTALLRQLAANRRRDRNQGKPSRGGAVPPRRCGVCGLTWRLLPVRSLRCRCARGRHARAPRAAGSRRAWSGSRLLRDRSRHEY